MGNQCRTERPSFGKQASQKRPEEEGADRMDLSSTTRKTYDVCTMYMFGDLRLYLSSCVKGHRARPWYMFAIRHTTNRKRKRKREGERRKRQRQRANASISAQMWRWQREGSMRPPSFDAVFLFSSCEQVYEVLCPRPRLASSSALISGDQSDNDKKGSQPKNVDKA